jgi:cyclopropane fatty-acyl-phospholipid synthase-like methyltransferase
MNMIAKEPHNQSKFENYSKEAEQLGPYTSQIWKSDPRHLAFLLARYKFCAKMLEGKASVLEIGCGDAFGMPMVTQVVGRVHGIDFEPLLLEDNRKRLKNRNCTFQVLDITKETPAEKFDAAYSLDVLEHIPKDIEEHYFKNIKESLTKSGVFVVGTPNITADKYASQFSRGHINLKSHAGLRADMSKHFSNVFMFSMNDEVVHTGYGPMAHYLFAVGTNPID